MNVTCSVQDCDDPVDRKGYCRIHYTRQYRHGTTGLIGPKPKPCARCGNVFQPQTNRAVYCSEDCRRGSSQCLNCGKTFVVSHGSSGQYCSRECWYSVDRASKPCPVCDKPFKGAGKTCSKACGYELRRRNHPVRRALCEHCGTEIVGRKPGTRYCSRSCSMYARTHARGGPALPVGTKRPSGLGYVQIKTENGWEFEHRVVLGEKLGRPLKSWPLENVHHRDGDRANNDPDNLELRTGATHGVGATKHCPTCTCEE